MTSIEWEVSVPATRPDGWRRIEPVSLMPGDYAELYGRRGLPIAMGLVCRDWDGTITVGGFRVDHARTVHAWRRVDDPTPVGPSCVYCHGVVYGRRRPVRVYRSGGSYEDGYAHPGCVALLFHGAPHLQGACDVGHG
ncbi:hypothetical protein CSQ85_09330 [Bifidobacterium rousetti]|uniref:hypothetical protein n=1 Tax=Bifidobacterium rousetti TaxID=2045439 RepID=UPI00123C0020|nr:hypothetical protein [Bifidobacterium rousetti]KAA8818353.1 hypothetical protein CSQ85_09330 [Bifidobacterium rousetti]